MTREIGRRIVTELTGDELFAFEHGPEKQITARDLRAYVGGDIAVPAFRLEAGAHARKISELPNAGHAMNTGDIITGVQNGQNVNFSLDQILAPLLEKLEILIQQHRSDREE